MPDHASGDTARRRARGTRQTGPEITDSTELVAFPFRFTPAYRALAAPFGIGTRRTLVTVSALGFDARFGPWPVTTPLANIAGEVPTGPYRLHRTAGSARYSFADGELTFASNGDRGLCLRFEEPVPGMEPTRSLRRPELTVTVADIDGLARLLAERIGISTVAPLDPAGRDRPGHVL